jgi:hypothetical protein
MVVELMPLFDQLGMFVQLGLLEDPFAAQVGEAR